MRDIISIHNTTKSDRIITLFGKSDKWSFLVWCLDVHQIIHHGCIRQLNLLVMKMPATIWVSCWIEISKNRTLTTAARGVLGFLTILGIFFCRLDCVCCNSSSVLLRSDKSFLNNLNKCWKTFCPALGKSAFRLQCSSFFLAFCWLFLIVLALLHSFCVYDGVVYLIKKIKIKGKRRGWLHLL